MEILINIIVIKKYIINIKTALLKKKLRLASMPHFMDFIIHIKLLLANNHLTWPIPPGRAPDIEANLTVAKQCNYIM